MGRSRASPSAPRTSSTCPHADRVRTPDLVRHPRTAGGDRDRREAAARRGRRPCRQDSYRRTGVQPHRRERALRHTESTCACAPRRELQPAERAYRPEPLPPVYARLREHSPVHRSVILGSWIISRYDDVLAVARDHEQFSNDPRWRNATASVFPPAPDDYSILLVDPPEHTRLRKVAARAFTRPKLMELEPTIEALANDIVDRAVKRGEVDRIGKPRRGGIQRARPARHRPQGAPSTRRSGMECKCIGAELARMETSAVIAAAAARIERISLAGPQPRYRRSTVVRGLERLEVRLERRPHAERT